MLYYLDYTTTTTGGGTTTEDIPDGTISCDVGYHKEDVNGTVMCIPDYEKDTLIRKILSNEFIFIALGLFVLFIFLVIIYKKK